MLTLLFLSVLAVMMILLFGWRLRPVWRAAIAMFAFVLVNMPTLVYWVVGDRHQDAGEATSRLEDQQVLQR